MSDSQSVMSDRKITRLPRAAAQLEPASSMSARWRPTMTGLPSAPTGRTTLVTSGAIANAAGSRIHRCQRRPMTLLRLAGDGGDHVCKFPGSVGSAGPLRSLGRPVARRQGAAVPGGAWADRARGRSTYVIDQGRQNPAAAVLGAAT
jgi:hypothetical protein